MSKLTESAAWQALKSHYEAVKDLHMRDLFQQDAKRFEKFSSQMEGILLDFSKNRITEETFGLLCKLAQDAGVEEWRNRMFAGEDINISEYRPGDASIADLDGDGEYEIVLHQAPRGRDNAQSGTTGEPIFEAYKLDGTFLWRINLGKNIREGAHYTQFMVYDLDGDGKAEFACKTADGTIDGQGKVIGDANADYRNSRGYILEGPEFLTIFDGLTGAALVTVDYIPPRHLETLHPTPQQIKDIWGDDYGNRVDRFLACIAYLDGERPSLVMCRGYYTKAVLAAWNFRDGQLSHVWTFDSEDGAVGVSYHDRFICLVYRRGQPG